MKKYVLILEKDPQEFCGHWPRGEKAFRGREREKDIEKIKTKCMPHSETWE